MPVKSNKVDTLRIAQKLFAQFYSQCFWSWNREHKVCAVDLPAIIKALKTYGGREGFLLASKLCL